MNADRILINYQSTHKFSEWLVAVGSQQLLNIIQYMHTYFDICIES